LGHRKSLFRINNTLFENNRIPMLPNAPYNTRPNSFPQEVLLAIQLRQEEVFEVQHKDVVLHKGDTNPFKT